MTDEFGWWAKRVEGEEPPIERGRVYSGFYWQRNRDTGNRDGVAIWRHDGKILVKTGRGKAARTTEIRDEADFAESRYSWIMANVVSEDDYFYWHERGSWPTDIPEPKVNANAPPDIVIKETVEELRRELDALLANVKEIQDKSTADLVANYKGRFAELEKEAKLKHATEKQPHLEAGRLVDGKWNPILSLASESKRRAADAVAQYLAAEKARQASRLALRAQEGHPVQEGDLKVHAGTRGMAVSLRTRRKGVITDPLAFATWCLEHDCRDDVMVVLQKLAHRIAQAGGEAPGLETKVETTAA